MFINAMCRSKAKLDGKTALITGANTGIGKATAEDFYKRGARVIIACRNMEKAEAAIKDIKARCADMNGLGEIVAVRLDLTSLKSVRQCAHEILETESCLDLLINNAGIMMSPEGRTEDGFEMQFGTNHLGHFLLTILLLPKIVKSTPARIVNVSSLAHESPLPYKINFDDINYEKRAYNSIGAYQQSKLCNILFTKELARRFAENNISGVNTYALHPGVINSELTRNMNSGVCPGMTCLYGTFMRWWAKTELQGAQTTIYCAVDEKTANETGLYYSDCAKKTPSRNARKVEDAKKLWNISMKYCDLENFDPFKDLTN